MKKCSSTDIVDDMNSRRFFQAHPVLIFACITLLVATARTPAEAQRKTNLPRAGFNVYTGGGPLPSGSGVHLDQGMDRPQGGPSEVYNPGEPKLGGKLVRWEPRHMPLKVWVSQGKKLPEEPFSLLQERRPSEVLNMLRSPAGLDGLQDCPGWKPEMVYAAVNGIEQWRELESPGVLQFALTDNPYEANIFVFWVDRFVDASGAGGVSVHGNTSATLFDVNQVRAAEGPGRPPVQGAPVVIELQINPELGRLQAEAAHEFGHALGIKEHSPYRQDIMYENRMVSLLSPSDKATLRWLYSQPTPYVMLPPVVPPREIAGHQPAQPASTVPVETPQPQPARYRVPVAPKIQVPDVEPSKPIESEETTPPAASSPPGSGDAGSTGPRFSDGY